VRLSISDEHGIYGTVHTSFGDVAVLVSEGETDDGIRIEKGGASDFRYFVFVPSEVRDELIANHNEGVFQQALIRVCELLQPPE
jgi:hypothetical protein